MTVTLRERLWNLARAELYSARRRLSEAGRAVLDGHVPGWSSNPGSGEPPWDESARASSGRPPRRERATDPRIRRYYANLELAEGASLDEVKAAYRRLIRVYHPDHHGGDPAAHRIAMELRTAYEGLKAHLEASPRR